MNRLSIFFTSALMLFTTLGSAQKYVGGDISMLPKYEEAGVVYRDKNGKAVSDVIAFFKQEGMNAMRVRLFVDPSKDSDKAVCQDLDFVKALGKRIKDAGLGFMLDFHYSDTWADPGNQWTPDAWKSLNDAQLQQKIYEYTRDCLQQLNAAGASPDFIQTGNEISYGMLWGTKAAANDDKTNRCYTNSSAANWARFINLLKQAGKACRETCPGAKIVIHSERVPKPGVLTDFFDRMRNASLDYDIIGLSYYPDHHGNLATLETALKTLENKGYGKDIMIVETGYGYKWSIGSEYNYTGTYPLSEEGQRKFTADLIEKLNGHTGVTGLFWWWPEDNGMKQVTSGWWNAALYDHNTGKPYAALYELKNFRNDDTGVDNLQLTIDNSQWYTLGGNVLCPSSSNLRPSTKGIYIHGGRKVMVK
ncbi:MAG: glycosyl hydrolase 53 family protein [Prevotella sp.]|nr:glycosyl hydrolase 53 family protein [Prevotella sp.]